MILGIDEVGRGPWAGPLVVGAVVLDEEIEGLTDSKKLSAKKRELLSKEVYDRALAVGLGWVSPGEIDLLGLSASLRLATKRAVKQIKHPFYEIIIDGTINFLSDTPLGSHVTVMKKADLLIPSVSAAAIVAKVVRDRYMAEQDETYPGYGFAGHVGYGTAKHKLAIERLGVTPLHRLSFAPLKSYALESDGQTEGGGAATAGAIAEDSVASYLEETGHAVVARNWRTKWCEIDLISVSNGTVYFTEVKYRKDVSRGGGLEAITSKKLQQMKFAAEMYLSVHGVNQPAMVAVASVSKGFVVDDWFSVD